MMGSDVVFFEVVNVWFIVLFVFVMCVLVDGVCVVVVLIVGK